MSQTPHQPDELLALAADGVTLDERQELVPDLLARRFAGDSRSYWQIVWSDFRKRRAAVVAIWVMALMTVMALFAPLLANHRPFVLIVSEEAGAALPIGSAAATGWQWPLFAALSMIDWMLLLGGAQIITAIIIRRRAKTRGNVVGRGVIALLVAAAVLPIVLAWRSSRSLRRALESRGTEDGLPADLAIGLLGEPQWKWIVLAIIALGGAALILRGALELLHQKRDVFGNLKTGDSIAGIAVGSLLILLFASWFGTLGQRREDATNYVQLAQRDGVRAIFPLIRHDYRSSESYFRHQAPLGPRLRVTPSGGSLAAVDLALTRARQHDSLASEMDSSSLSSNAHLTLDTPLAALRGGEGLRTLGGPTPDFNIITAGLDRVSVSLAGATTIGDVIERINRAARGTIDAHLAADGSRIVLNDLSQPRPTHLAGTDASGSDVAARIIHATRVALSIGFVSTGIALFIGITVGALMGYFGGWVDIVGMRIIEIFMAIPQLFLLLTVIAFIPPELNAYMLYAMMAVIGAFSWMTSARFIRAEFFRLRDQDFIHAAKACGLPLRSVLFKHMLPNGVTPVLVDASFGVAAAIFLETGLSFLGFGIKPPEPSWGKMLADAVDPTTGVFYWWMAVFPGVMIFLTVFAFNLIGDALRDAIDPKLKKAAH